MVSVETDQTKFLDDCAAIQWGGGYGFNEVDSPWVACPPYPDPQSLSDALNRGGSLYVARDDTGALQAFCLMDKPNGEDMILWVNTASGMLTDPAILLCGSQINEDLGSCYAYIDTQEAATVANLYPEHFRADIGKIHCLG